MTTVRRSLALLAVCACVTGCAGRLPISRPLASGSDSDSGSGASSAGSGNSSAGSGDSGSGNSSAGSGQSSGASGNSSGESGQSSANSSASSNASGESSQQSSGSTGNESTQESTANSSRATTDGTTAESANGNTVATLVPVSSTTTLAGTTAAIVVSIWSQSKPSPQAEAAAYIYLRSIRHRLEEDLALGAGNSLVDLASLAHIRTENLPRFCRMLHSNRRELLALIDARTLTPERAGRALRRLGEWAEADPLLAEDGREALVRVTEAP